MDESVARRYLLINGKSRNHNDCSTASRGGDPSFFLEGEGARSIDFYRGKNFAHHGVPRSIAFFPLTL